MEQAHCVDQELWVVGRDVEEAYERAMKITGEPKEAITLEQV